MSALRALRAARWRNHGQHDLLHKAAMERAMKVQEVILRALAKRIKWWQAAEIMRVRDRCQGERSTRNASAM
jgi:hypothetical protein